MGAGSAVTDVELRPVDRENVRAVCELQLAPGQEEHVAPASRASRLRTGWDRARAVVRTVEVDKDAEWFDSTGPALGADRAT